MTTPKVLVLLCTYNERSNLPEVVQSTWQVLPQADVLVVDDNSPDGTGDWVKANESHWPQLHLLQRPGKLGLGSALRDGMAWCLEREFDFLINLDADLSHDPSRIAALLEVAVQQSDSPEHSTVSIGSRYVVGGQTLGLSFARRWLSRILNAYATTLLGLNLRDCSGSYRCYPVPLLKRLQLERLKCNGYGFLEEILCELRNIGAHFVEMPITYHMRGSGNSKLSLSDALGAVAVIHRLAFQRILGSRT